MKILNKSLRNNRGAALMIAVFLMLVMMIVIPTGFRYMASSMQEVRFKNLYVSMADNTARAGIVDAISWFRRQNATVSGGTFFPDGAFIPLEAQNDTEDETVGLVKDFEINGNVRGRYILRRIPNVGVVDDFAVRDITSERIHDGDFVTGEGIVWLLNCTGFVYLRAHSDPNWPIDRKPNRILARTSVSTEIIRMLLRTDSAAVRVNDGGTGQRTVVVNNNGEIQPGSDAVGCGRTIGQPPRTVGSGTCPIDTDFDDNLVPTSEYVFGLSQRDVRNIADFVVNEVDDLPNPMPDMRLFFVNGDATFTNADPLSSSGILFVDGDLVLEGGPNTHFFSGVIYVTGNATINDSALISGSVVVLNEGGDPTALTVSRAGSANRAIIIYDGAIVNAVRQQICVYREIKSAFRTFTGIHQYDE